MDKDERFVELLYSLDRYIDLGTIGEELFDGSASIDRKRDSEGFTAEDKARIRGMLLHIAERVKDVADHI